MTSYRHVEGEDYGLWQKKETNKTICFTCIDGDDVGYRYVINKNGKSSHTLKIHSDGDYVLYANRNGIPLLLTPVKDVSEDNGDK